MPKARLYAPDQSAGAHQVIIGGPCVELIEQEERFRGLPVAAQRLGELELDRGASGRHLACIAEEQDGLAPHGSTREATGAFLESIEGGLLISRGALGASQRTMGFDASRKHGGGFSQ